MVVQRVRNPKQFGLTFANHEKFRKHQRSDPDIKHLYKVTSFYGNMNSIYGSITSV